MGFFSACCSSKTNHIEVAIMQFIKLLPIGKNGNRFRKSINPLSGYNDSKVTAKRPTKKNAFEKSVGIINAAENVIFLRQSHLSESDCTN